MQEKSSNKLSPQLWRQENENSAIVAGFDLGLVQFCACEMISRGFVPAVDDYSLYEHIKTGEQGHLRRITFIKKHE